MAEEDDLLFQVEQVQENVQPTTDSRMFRMTDRSIRKLQKKREQLIKQKETPRTKEEEGFSPEEKCVLPTKGENHNYDQDSTGHNHLDVNNDIMPTEDKNCDIDGPHAQAFQKTLTFWLNVEKKDPTRSQMRNISSALSSLNSKTAESLSTTSTPKRPSFVRNNSSSEGLLSSPARAPPSLGLARAPHRHTLSSPDIPKEPPSVLLAHHVEKKVAVDTSPSPSPRLSSPPLLNLSDNIVLKETSTSSPMKTPRKGKSKDIFTIKELKLERLPWTTLKKVDDSDLKPNTELFCGSTMNWQFELGGKWSAHLNLKKPTPVLEEFDKYLPVYSLDFTKPHMNFFGKTEKDTNPVIVSVIEKTKSEDKKKTNFLALIRTVDEDKKVEITLESDSTKVKDKKALTKELTTGLGVIIGGKMSFNDHPKLSEALLHFEERQVPKGVKIGVLLKKQGQATEEEWFNNQEPTPAFEEFLDFLGKKIKLKGWTRYRGGLDVNNDSTGTHSYATTYENLPIMFHVSTCLPFFPKDPQQLERKRHLGNDVIVIIFNESDEPFDPSIMKSEFNQVYVVVSPAGTKKGTNTYKLGFASKSGTPLFGPLLTNPVFRQGHKLRDFLLSKLLNGERAAMHSPSFKPKIVRTRKMLLDEIQQNFAEKKRNRLSTNFYNFGRNH